jgi:ABC-type lipoprotein release transport system permease subunit
LSANGIPRKPVVAALLVEPVVAAVLGSLVGVALAVIGGIALNALGLAPTGVATSGLLVGTGTAIVVSIVAALATSIVPTWNAASRPPIRSLNNGG